MRRLSKSITPTQAEGQVLPDSTPNPLLSAALYYAGLGWAVFPVHSIRDGKCSCGKRNCGDAGKHPRYERGTLENSYQSASTDEELIRHWWSKWPDANVGMAVKDGWVLDEDVPGTAEELLGETPKTLTARTPSGGRHFFFRKDERIRGNSTGSLPEGFDVRGSGSGYVIVPPSQGREWVDASPPTKAPEHVLEMLRQPEPSSLDSDGERAPASVEGPPIPDGTRHKVMASIAGRLHDGTRSLTELEADLDDINKARCQPPLPEKDIEKLVRSYIRKQPCSPGKSAELKEKIEALEHAFWHAYGDDWQGIAGQSRRSVVRALLEAAARFGKLTKEGAIRFDLRVQTVAELAEVCRPTVYKAAEWLITAGWLRRDTYHRAATEAGAWFLLPPAQSFTTHNQPPPTTSEGEVEVCCKTPRSPGVVGLKTPEFKHFGIVGKGKGGVLLALEAYGPMDAECIAELHGTDRVRDVRRRYLDPLVEQGRLSESAGAYSLPGDHLGRCEEAKSTPYSNERRRRLRMTDDSSGRVVTVVRESGTVASEYDRAEKSHFDYEKQREAFRLALARKAAQEGEVESVCFTQLKELQEAKADHLHPDGCRCIACYHAELVGAA